MTMCVHGCMCVCVRVTKAQKIQRSLKTLRNYKYQVQETLKCGAALEWTTWEKLIQKKVAFNVKDPWTPCGQEF